MTFVILALVGLGVLWAAATALDGRGEPSTEPPSTERSRDEHVRALQDLVGSAEEAVARADGALAKPLVERALAFAERHLEEDAPEASPAWLLLGMLFSRDDAWAEAAACFERAAALARPHPPFAGTACRALEELALACALLRRDDQADLALDEAEARRADAPELLHQTLSMRAEVDVVRGDLQRAEHHQRAALRALGDGLGAATPYRGRLPAAGHARREATSWRALATLAVILYRAERLDEARATLQAALTNTTGRDAADLLELARHLEGQGLLEAALALALAVEGQHEPDALLDASRVARQLGRRDDAEALAERAGLAPGADPVRTLVHRAWLRFVELDLEAGEQLIARAAAEGDGWRELELTAEVLLARAAARFASDEDAFDWSSVELPGMDCVDGLRVAELALWRGNFALAERKAGEARHAAERGPRGLVRYVARFEALRFAVRGDFDGAEMELVTVAAPRVPALERAGLAQDAAWRAYQRGRFAEAAQGFEEAARTLPSTSDPRALVLARAGCAAALAQAGRSAEARAALDQALGSLEALSPHDPERAYAGLAQAQCARVEGRGAAALESADQAIAIYLRWYGRRAPGLPAMLLERARALALLGRTDDARAAARHAHAAALAAHGPDHPHVAEHAHLLATLVEPGDAREARALLEHARAVMAAHGHEHLPRVSAALVSLLGASS